MHPTFRSILLLQPVPHYYEQCYQDGKLFLRLDWAASQLQHYNMEAAAKPAVHASASAAAMKGKRILQLLAHSKSACNSRMPA